MEYLENRHSFAAVIGDIKDSRKLENRKEVQKRLQKVLDRLNRKYEEDIVSSYLITLGDEFQGLLCSGKNILNMINEIKMEMYPVRLRFGIGFGTITTDIRREMALGADGPGYYRAREAVEVLKEREKKNRPVPADLCLKMEEEDRDKEVLLNTVFDLLYVVEEGWTERQREIIELYYFKGMTQQEIADELGIGQRAVSHSLEGTLKKLKKVF